MRVSAARYFVRAQAFYDNWVNPPSESPFLSLSLSLSSPPPSLSFCFSLYSPPERGNTCVTWELDIPSEKHVRKLAYSMRPFVEKNGRKSFSFTLLQILSGQRNKKLRKRRNLIFNAQFNLCTLYNSHLKDIIDRCQVQEI